MTEKKTPPSTAADRKAKVDAIRKSGGAERRSRLLFAGGVTAAVALIAAGTWYGISTGEEVRNSAAPAAVTASQGLPVGDADAPVVVDSYEDFYCSACDKFEAQVSQPLAELVEAGLVRVNYHMMSFVVPGASEDAASAGACAADAGKFGAFHDAFYAAPVGEQTGPATPSDLVDLGRAAGIDDPEFAQCVLDGTYRTWADKVDVAAAQKKISSTPTVFVDGAPVAQGNPQAFLDALEAAIAKDGNTDHADDPAVDPTDGE